MEVGLAHHVTDRWWTRRCISEDVKGWLILSWFPLLPLFICTLLLCDSLNYSSSCLARTMASPFRMGHAPHTQKPWEGGPIDFVVAIAKHSSRSFLYLPFNLHWIVLPICLSPSFPPFQIPLIQYYHACVMSRCLDIVRGSSRTMGSIWKVLILPCWLRCQCRGGWYGSEVDAWIVCLMTSQIARRANSNGRSATS